jgi:hypothetical protein
MRFLRNHRIERARFYFVFTVFINRPLNLILDDRKKARLWISESDVLLQIWMFVMGLSVGHFRRYVTVLLYVMTAVMCGSAGRDGGVCGLCRGTEKRMLAFGGEPKEETAW